MNSWWLIASGCLAVISLIVVKFGHVRERAKTDAMQKKLTGNAPQWVDARVDFASFSDLPAPVARYFRHVLTDGQQLIGTASINQSGKLRASTTAKSWSQFTAQQLVVPPAVGFIWNARVAMPLATHVRVIDSYVAGLGGGRVSVLSAIPVACAAAVPELNSGALHRYLAEAPWFPTALLPQSGVLWTPIDDCAALATLSHQSTTVSLEFRFNDSGEVTGIYSPGRFGAFDGGYRQVPWEGHFSNYQIRAGMRIPLRGEVGWYIDGVLQIVWRGDLLDVHYAPPG
jgi:hypothetical protein